MSRQDEVFKYLQKNGASNKEEIYQNVSFSYYHNWAKNLGVLLKRMVDNGKVIRVKRGVYKLSETRIPLDKKPIDPNQSNLFS